MGKLKLKLKMGDAVLCYAVLLSTNKGNKGRTDGWMEINKCSGPSSVSAQSVAVSWFPVPCFLVSCLLLAVRYC